MSSVNSVFLLLGSVIAAGFVLRKSGAVGENDYKIYFKLITTLIIPCLILSNFRTVELTPEYLSILRCPACSACSCRRLSTSFSPARHAPKRAWPS